MEDLKRQKNRIIAKIDRIHQKAFNRVGSPSAVLYEDVARYDSLIVELVKLNKKHGFSRASSAITGKPFITHVCRLGKLGIFYSDLPAREFKGKLRWKIIKFDNPIVFKNQWDAIEKLFSKSKAKSFHEEYRHLQEEVGLSRHLGTLAQAVEQPKIVNFWARLDRIIIIEAREKGYDGIVYHHGKKRGFGEYIDIEKPPTVADLLEVQVCRSQRSQAMDLSRKHSVTLKPDSPKVKQWMKDPGKADISGIDTPPITRRSPRLSGGRVRITPKRPRLRG